ncbi:MAG: hypothetical protein B0D92_05410 [Spirochaeta sp. LUC14_002_19_P3]|nr:MAG: hypothetical protein B0D92_05410 [Spirochaeta sp. LUC14_002_19_P3]
MNEDSPFVQAGEVLNGLFEKYIPSATGEYTTLTSGWSQIAGNELSFHVIPKDVVNGILVLEADHPGWIQKFRMEERKILKIIKKKYPVLNINKIKIYTIK